MKHINAFYCRASGHNFLRVALIPYCNIDFIPTISQQILSVTLEIAIIIIIIIIIVGSS